MADYDSPTDIEPQDAEPVSNPCSMSLTTSLKSSVLNYEYENGRRYGGAGQSKYFIPADEDESNRLDLCAHMFSLLMHGELHLAPIGPDPHRILDVGTGTGLWAMDMAEKYPSATVLGTDIAAVQPSFVPPNVEFEINDANEDWGFSAPFDFVHARYLGGAIRDWPKFVGQAYKYAKPGAWVEFMDFTMTFYTTHGAFRPGCAVDRWTEELKAALIDFGLEPEPGSKLGGWVNDAGFQNVSVKKIALPVGLWPKDRTLKEVGTINLIQFLDNLEAFSLRPMTARGWSVERINEFLREVRRDFKDPTFQMQHDGFIVYGQRPME
ncbi:S-adenosyl-L-methionine-dependent methyltransferase [Trichodelitschia bisporula]|uniref:S-adenosyl-L-methionine-dependent methyltransferase n=1 Tax=Trichodelitschia bisporula TaxID=703511 RepID=A0A6G1HLP7_9PEZI|nr:S-adenosyl-L-methionine-dependent methyltransferase [Trichodelitschia bisporula]